MMPQHYKQPVFRWLWQMRMTGSKALADVITMQDNDHDGCAEVIQKYLLS